MYCRLVGWLVGCTFCPRGGGLLLLAVLSAAGLLGLALPGLDAVLAHGKGPVDAVQLEVETARVADGLSLVVAAPQGGGARAAVGAAQAQAPGRRLKFQQRTLIIYVSK